MSSLEARIKEILPSLIEFRHELHQHPELGYQEVETAKRLLAVLEQLPGFTVEHSIAKTGIVATLNSEKSGSCVALRSDMDALPILERTGKPYSSKIDGRMHACGHDGHMTCLIGAARILSDMRDEIDGPVKFIFQPAEEGGAGGREMCKEGALENPKVDAIFGLHCNPMEAQGTIRTFAGPCFASGDTLTIRVKGKCSHAATPFMGIDSVAVASHIIVALQTLVTRMNNPLDPVVISICKVTSGTAHNLLAEEALLEGTARSFTNEGRVRLIEQIRNVATNVAKAFGAEVEVSSKNGYPPVINEPRATRYFQNIAKEAIGSKSVMTESTPVTFAEDFAFYGEHVPATFWLLGIRPPNAKTYPFLHDADFDFCDESIPYAVKLHVETARNFARLWNA